MKPILFTLALALSVLPQTPTPAQDSTDELESAGRSLLADPRLQNMLRSVKNDPAATVDAVRKAPEDTVRDATAMFLQTKEQLESSSINTPENRAKAREISEAAVATATDLAGSNEGTVSEVRTAIENATGEEVPTMVAAPVATPVEEPAAPVPATRSADSTTRFVTPIAMPDEQTLTPLAADAMPLPVVQNESVEPLADTAPTVQNIPNSPELNVGSIPEPKPLTPKYDTRTGGSRTAGEDQMVITARNSVMDNNSGLLTFTGDVFLDHPSGNIKCDRLEVYMDKAPGAAPTEAGGSFKKAIASGGMVEIRRIDESGKEQIAMARRAEFDNLTKDIVLSGGPPYIQDGPSFVETNSVDAKIIMRGNGKYEITGSDASTNGRSRIVIPVKDTGQNKDTGIGLGGLLER